MVIDASLALKWELNDEQHVDQAVNIRDACLLSGNIRLLAPSLFLYEVINGVTVAGRRLRFETTRGAQMIRRLFSVGVLLQTPDPGTVHAAAVRFGISAYDSAYIALAESERLELWTADRRLFDAVARDLQWVRWLGDWQNQA